jgi:hypothetical protein
MKRCVKQLEKGSEMKKRSAMFLAAAMAAFGAWAETETVGGYTWTYRIHAETVEIMV